jgi:hypothetical protein
MITCHIATRSIEKWVREDKHTLAVDEAAESRAKSYFRQVGERKISGYDTHG